MAVMLNPRAEPVIRSMKDLRGSMAVHRELTGNRPNTHRGRGATHGLLNLLLSSSCPILSHNVHDSHCGSYNCTAPLKKWTGSQVSRMQETH